jgi:uncharacterized membrane protein (UPF0127 family)
MNIKYILFVVALIAITGLAYKVYRDNYAEDSVFDSGQVTFMPQNIKIKVKVAENNAQRSQGLMFVKKMSENEGMIFLFPTEQKQAFWMKNTYIPLDIIYLGADFKVRNIHENATPMSEEIIPSVLPTKYVVEVNAGFVKKHGIKFGDSIEFKQ